MRECSKQSRSSAQIWRFFVTVFGKDLRQPMFDQVATLDSRTLQRTLWTWGISYFCWVDFGANIQNCRCSGLLLVMQTLFLRALTSKPIGMFQLASGQQNYCLRSDYMLSSLLLYLRVKSEIALSWIDVFKKFLALG